LTIHTVHFYDWRLVCPQVKVINGFVVGYLDVHGRTLLQNGIEIAQELCAQFDSDRNLCCAIVIIEAARFDASF
jgi:hypothetical protein